MSDPKNIPALHAEIGKLQSLLRSEQDELKALRKEVQSNRGQIARYRIRLDILREALAGTYDSSWPSNDYECDIFDAVVALRAENERLQTLLRDWQEFAKDSFVTVGEREFDKLGDLERRTQEVLEP